MVPGKMRTWCGMNANKDVHDKILVAASEHFTVKQWKCELCIKWLNLKINRHRANHINVQKFSKCWSLFVHGQHKSTWFFVHCAIHLNPIHPICKVSRLDDSVHILNTIFKHLHWNSLSISNKFRRSHGWGNISFCRWSWLHNQTSMGCILSFLHFYIPGPNLTSFRWYCDMPSFW